MLSFSHKCTCSLWHSLSHIHPPPHTHTDTHSQIFELADDVRCWGCDSTHEHHWVHDVTLDEAQRQEQLLKHHHPGWFCCRIQLFALLIMLYDLGINTNLLGFCKRTVEWEITSALISVQNILDSVRQHGPKGALNLSGGRWVRQHSPEEALKLNGGRSPGANMDVMAAIGCTAGVCGKSIIWHQWKCPIWRISWTSVPYFKH